MVVAAAASAEVVVTSFSSPAGGTPSTSLSMIFLLMIEASKVSSVGEVCFSIAEATDSATSLAATLVAATSSSSASTTNWMRLASGTS